MREEGCIVSKRFDMREFVFKQYCIPWKIRLLVKYVVPWKIRRYLLYGRVNLNSPEAMDLRYSMQDDTFVSMENLYEYIIGLLPHKGRVLDAGCGIAVLLRMIRDRRPDLELYGIDFSQVAVARTRRYGFKAELAVLPDIPYPSGFFDVIISTEVLEHLERPDETVRSFFRVLKSAGRVIVSVPKGMGPDHCIEHLHDFDKDTLTCLFSDNGFVVEHLALVEREPHRKPGASYVLVASKP